MIRPVKEHHTKGPFMLSSSRMMMCALLLAGLVISGCGSDQSGGTMTDRQEKAMRDPFGYTPDMNRTDITGGGVGNFNKSAFGKDLDDVVNP